MKDIEDLEGEDSETKPLVQSRELATKNGGEVLAEALDGAALSAFHRVAFFFSAFVWFSQGTLITVDSLCFSAIKKEFKLSDPQLAAYNYNLGAGIFVGALLSSASDVFGRRSVFLAFSLSVNIIIIISPLFFE